MNIPTHQIHDLPAEEREPFKVWLNAQGCNLEGPGGFRWADYDRWQRSIGRIPFDEIARNLGIDMDDIRRGGPRPKLVDFEQS